MPPDSTSNSSFANSILQNHPAQLVALFLTIIGGVLTIFPNIKSLVVRKCKYIFNYISFKFSNNKQRKIQSQVIDFLNSKTGKKYVINHPNQELTKKIYSSFRKLRKNNVVSQIEEDVYYVYLFSLLEKTVARVWAASISDPLEWTDTDEEKLFLQLNINVSNRKVPVERIFIVKEAEIIDFLKIIPIQKQILHNEKSEYYFTYYAYENEIPKALLREIANGFLAFDDFVVAKDVFSDKEIRGIIETQSLAFYNKIFTKLRQFTHPLDLKYYELKISKPLTT